ncbi:MAG: flagellar type III secretion system pore protein FliP [Gammaproteobacteria bacterium]|nr:flagellar type III secretion system pore protein FliP [Gammaproteobacteria bacterium]
MRIWLLLMLSLMSLPLAAEPGALPALTVTTTPDGGQEYSVTLQVLVLMTMLSFLPAIVIMMTSFTRIAIVLSILRQAIGLNTTPSNQIVVGLSLFMTLFIMTPVFNEVIDKAVDPYMAEEITMPEALKQAQLPFRAFMLDQTRQSDLASFSDIAKLPDEQRTPETVPMTVLIPAFVTSELKTAFQIGFMLFIPFLVIDLVVASILMAMGMMMLSPMIVALPFKLMLFVLVDGWTLVLTTLAASFG